jgi:hypothetical protein
MAQVRLFRIVVASPGDVKAERDALDQVVDELNRTTAADRDLRIELSRWETDAHPGFHTEGPQGLIDESLRIRDCDLLVGIYWKRFGTPVTDAPSGTAHEICTALEGWAKNRRPQVMLYFNQRPYRPTSKAETDQWGQVLEFQRTLPKETFWWPYKGKTEFEKLVREHLHQILRKQAPLVELPHLPGVTASNSSEMRSRATASPTQYPRGERVIDRALDELMYSTLATVCRAVSLPQSPETLKLRAFVFQRSADRLVCLHSWSPDPTIEVEGKLRFPLDPQAAEAVIVARAAMESSLIGAHVKPLPPALKGVTGQVSEYLRYVLAAPNPKRRRQRMGGGGPRRRHQGGGETAVQQGISLCNAPTRPTLKASPLPSLITPE